MLLSLHLFMSVRLNLRKLRYWILSWNLLLNLYGPTCWAQLGPNGHSHITSHIVTTKYGSLRGLKFQFSSSSTKHLDPVSAYLGIPYASPPINAYRFMPPVAPLPWGQGIRLAIFHPPACPQKLPDTSNKTRALEEMTLQRYEFLQRILPHLTNQSEDCLYLNFYVPILNSGEEIRAGRFPILFVIHGESWEWGSGNEFDGGILASLGNHIVVTFNYRLGILGFMKTSNQRGNFGLLDVIAALHYVRENGDAFGGDRNRITLLGYRTGAAIANLLLIAQIAKDLFQRAILISGSVLSPWALQKRPEEISLQVANQLGCKGRLPLNHVESDLAPCLRKKHLSELLNFVPDSPRFLSPFAPYVDNNLLRNPKVIMEGGGSSSFSTSNGHHPISLPIPLNDQFRKSHLLLITTTSEGIHELNDEEVKHGFESEHRDRILRTLVRNLFNYHQQEIFSIVRNEYTDWERPILHPIPLRDATVEALSDCLAVAPIIQLALTHAKIPRASSTYFLHFAHVSKELEGSPYERLGSLEGDVVPYAMGLPLTNGIPALGGSSYISPWSSLGNFSKQDAIVSETLIHYLSNFVHSGDPNSNEFLSHDWNSGSGNSREKVRLRSQLWEPFDGISQVYMNIGLKPRLKNHYRGHKLALWLNLIPQIHVPGGSDVSPAHHYFPDSSQFLYIGPVRQLSSGLSFADQIPGVDSFSSIGITSHFLPPPGPTQPIVGSDMAISTSATGECIEPTTGPDSSSSPSFSKGIISSSLDLDEESGSGISGTSGAGARGLGSRDTILSPSSSAGPREPEYDYTTALTVTLTVGVCLILLNLLVFSAIMCHRKRGGGGGSPTSVSSCSESPGSHRHGSTTTGTPLKSSQFQNPHQNQDEWMNRMSCQDEVEGESYNTGGHHHMSSGCGGIRMSQYSGDYCASGSLIRRSNCGREDFGNPPLPLTSVMIESFPYCCTPNPSSSATTATMEHQLPIPNCIPPHPLHHHHPHSHYQQLQLQPLEQHCICPASSNTSDTGIRLYMNRTNVTGEGNMTMLSDNVGNVPDSLIPITPPPPPSSVFTTNSLRRLHSSSKISSTGGSFSISSPPSSNSGTTSVSTPPNNPSPSGGTNSNTTLVSALKRHSGSGTPTTTIKKRVQIQEISV